MSLSVLLLNIISFCLPRIEQQEGNAVSNRYSFNHMDSVLFCMFMNALWHGTTCVFYICICMYDCEMDVVLSFTHIFITVSPRIAVTHRTSE